MQESEVPQSAEQWHAEIRLAQSAMQKWEERAKKVVKRYRDERTESEDARRYNILWANVQVLRPAVFSRRPKPEVTRRFKDQDKLGRIAATILERALDYETEHYGDVQTAIENALDDRLLPGRGVAWIRYEPTIETVSDAPQDDAQDGYDRLAHECSPVEYVHWQDFLTSPARTWAEVRWVARGVYMTREAGVKRFGKKFDRVPLGETPLGMTDEEAAKHGERFKQARIWEIWSKPDKRAIWIAKGFDEILDARDDPLELGGFFPPPPPLYATLTTDSLVPVPDYCEYQDQAEDLDLITQRIQLLTDACKVAGVYDASAPAIGRLLDSGENKLVPVDSWAAFAERGGLKGAVDYLPIDQIAKVLQALYQNRDMLVQTVYEITGISDILRGSTKAQETLGAQRLKANYGGLRLKELQNDIARFATDLYRRKAEIMCSKYRPQTILEMASVESVVSDTDVSLEVSQQMQALQQRASQLQQGQQPGPALQQMLAQAQQQATAQAKQMLAQQAVELLTNEPLRNFRIEVNADSFIELDEEQEKQTRIEFMQGMGAFFQQAMPLAQAFPESVPLVGEMLKFAARGFRAGKGMESALEEFIERLKNRPPPGPDPKLLIEQEKAKVQQQSMQMKAELDQQKAELDQQKAQADIEIKQREFQLEKARAEMEMAMERAKMQAEIQMDREKAAADMQLQRAQADQDMAVARQRNDEEIQLQRDKFAADAGVDLPTLQREQQQVMDSQQVREALMSLAQMVAQAAEQQQRGLQQLAQIMSRTREVVRNADGRIVGVR